MRYSPFRHAGSALRKRRPIQLTVFLTRICNARCPFCFYLSRNEGPGPAPELTLEELEKVSSSVGSLLWLAFSGGEPFLREDLTEIAGVFYKNTRPSIILLPTNGLLPGAVRKKTEEILKRCTRSTVVVKLSLDGPPDVHDKLRGVSGAFERTLETYRGLRELLGRYPNFELGINSVFCSANQDRMKELIGFVRGLDKVRTHTVSLIRGEVSDERLKSVAAEQYRETIEVMEENLRTRASSMYRFPGARLKAAQDILQRRLIHQTLLQQRRLVPCHAGRLTLVLTELGDVYPCEAFEKRLGNVRESGCDIGNMLRTEKAQAAIQSIKNSGCFCTHECYMMMNILFNPRLYPALIREYLRLGPGCSFRSAGTGPALSTARTGS
jgi:radical SAM protein with 4Fe4S-binding SPASM domain